MTVQRTTCASPCTTTCSSWAPGPRAWRQPSDLSRWAAGPPHWWCARCAAVLLPAARQSKCCRCWRGSTRCSAIGLHRCAAQQGEGGRPECVRDREGRGSWQVAPVTFGCFLLAPHPCPVQHELVNLAPLIPGCGLRWTAGAHILSGNVLQPTALDELLPAWREDDACPIKQPATGSRFYFLTRQLALRLPNPPQMAHRGNFVISLRRAGCTTGPGRLPFVLGTHPPPPLL